MVAGPLAPLSNWASFLAARMEEPRSTSAQWLWAPLVRPSRWHSRTWVLRRWRSARSPLRGPIQATTRFPLTPAAPHWQGEEVARWEWSSSRPPWEREKLSWERLTTEAAALRLHRSPASDNSRPATWFAARLDDDAGWSEMQFADFNSSKPTLLLPPPNATRCRRHLVIVAKSPFSPTTAYRRCRFRVVREIAC